MSVERDTTPADLQIPKRFTVPQRIEHAILAVLAVFVGHFYNVPIKLFNESMFTGRLTRPQMEEEHGEELDGLVASRMLPAPSPLAMRRRDRVFIPIAIIIGAFGVGSIYWAAGVRNNSVSALPATIPRPPVYDPLKSDDPPTASSKVLDAPVIPHPIAGNERCYGCHDRSGIKSVAANHKGRPVESCRICHKPGSAAKLGGTIADRQTGGKLGRVPHSIEEDGFKDCTKCHGSGSIRPFPASHAGFAPERCPVCHKPASGGG